MLFVVEIIVVYVVVLSTFPYTTPFIVYSLEQMFVKTNGHKKEITISTNLLSLQIITSIMIDSKINDDLLSFLERSVVLVLFRFN